MDWAARFGLPKEGPKPNTRIKVAPDTTKESMAAACDSCGRAVSDAVVRFCAAHADRFGGRTLCYRCQRRKPGTAK